MLALNTGMRIGEVFGLRWCDVDFETGLISIRHSVAYAKGMGSFIKDTKTHDARGIPIDPVGLLPFLKETHEIDCGKLRLRGLTGAVEIGDCYILSEPGATFATTSYIRRAFKTFSETNGLMGTNDELITFHGLRHTFATQWIRQGGDIKALQSILGHKDAMATLNVYADIEPISKIHNMLRVSPCLWRGYLGPRVDPGPMFQQRIQESIETLQAFGYGVTEPDDRNIVIRDVKTISRLYPTEYAAVLGPSQLRSRWSDRGAARGMRDFIMITLGTGVGSGIVINGQLVYGHDGFAGELGHVIRKPNNGRICGCGRTGCLEAYCSATGVARTAREFLETRTDPSSLRQLEIENITSKDVYEAAATGDKMAKEIFEYTGKMLGDAFADFVAFSSPQAIVLFGGLARSGEMLLKPLREEFEKALMPVFRGKTKIILSELKESDAAVLGASALGWEAKYRAEVPISSVPTVAEVPASDESKEA